VKRQFNLFHAQGAVGLDDLLKQIPAGVEPQDVTLVLTLRGVDTDTDVTVNWEDPE
jgi:hypothetical protein